MNPSFSAVGYQHTMYQFVVLFTLVCSALGQSKLPGTCDMKPGQAVGVVDVLRMLGTWYEVQRVPNVDESGDCSTMSFDLINPAIGYIITREEVDGTFRERRGTIYKDDDTTGRFVVNYDSGIYHYYVLSMDYANYALIYACKDNSDDTKNVWAWLLTRSRDYAPSDEALADFQAAVTRNPDLMLVNWTQPRQDGCSN